MRTLTVVTAVSLAIASCAGADAAEDEEPTPTTAPPTTTTMAPTTTTTTEAPDDHTMDEESVDTEALAAANLGAAPFQDVALAEAAGYASTLQSLGCFEDPELGGMGLHYLREDLLDSTLNAAEPEALVYELDNNGEIAGLIAHEYLVPLEAWTEEAPPSLFGLEFHQHPVLPFWILHTWIWKDNPGGTFNDWNPKVRPCPEGVPIFGVDLP